jgi:hypothetical protein
MDAKLEITNLINLCRLGKTTIHFHKHDVTKIRQNGVVNLVVSNSTVVFYGVERLSGVFRQTI